MTILLERCGICDDPLYRVPVGDPRCDSCIDERHKGRAWAEGAIEVLRPLLERLQAPVTNITFARPPTAEDGLRIREALDAKQRAYGGEKP